jgi:predicted  nucleic acid-binding Zn-ribbon protein
MAELIDGSKNSRELKRLVAALQRESRRLPALEQEVSAGRQAWASMQTQVRDQQRALAGAVKLIAEVEKALASIVAMEHGKRTDRRLARAQRMAQRTLVLVGRWQEDAPAVEVRPRRGRRPASGSSGRGSRS